jgi:DNA-binding NtrC family response regulator
VLSSYFLKQLAKSCSKRFTGFSPAAMQRLTDYGWPGNVRELRNVIERAVILASGCTVEEEHLVIRPAYPPEQAAWDRRAAPVESLADMEKRLIQRVLEETNWQKARSAKILGINRTTLWQKIKRYGLTA